MLKKLLNFSIILYISFAPVYWLPGISISQFRIVKIGVFALILGLYLFMITTKCVRVKKLPNILNLIYWLLIITLLPSISVSMKDISSIDVISELLNYIFNYFALLLGYNYLFIYQDLDEFKFQFPVIVIAILSVLTISNFITGIPDYVVDKQPLWMTGFTNKRTGWSGGIAQLVPMGLILCNKRNLYSLIGIISILIIIVSQYFSGGRGGLIASLFSITLFVFFYANRKVKIVTIIAISICCFYFFDFINIAMRLDTGNFSSDRVGQYLEFLKYFPKRPFTGYGLEGSSTILGGHELHNVWLRLILDYGIFNGLISLMLIIGIVVYLFKRMLIIKRNYYIVGLFCLNSSIILISMVEPKVIFGVFQLWFPWWFFTGILIKLTNKK